MPLDMKILGLHHITIVCANAQRTIDFYTQVLGLRLVNRSTIERVLSPVTSPAWHTPVQVERAS